MKESLEHLRDELNDVDARIVEALAQRHRIVSQVANDKMRGTASLLDTQRENEIIARLSQMAEDNEIDPQLVKKIYREILDHSVRCQESRFIEESNRSDDQVEELVVAFQGVEGAYSHIAATQHFAPRNERVRFEGLTTFRHAVQAVCEGEAHISLLPIENTTAGSINETYDLLAEKNLAVVGEEVVKVDHCLLALESVPITRIKRIYSHPQALTQCSRFLSSLTDCEAISADNTAVAASKLCEDQDLSEAAIASEWAAELYNLTILKRGIANQGQNFTRFVVVASQAIDVDQRIPCKTSLVFAARDEDGALAKCLNVFAEHHINLTKLESRPRPNAPWEYLFYVDFEGNTASDNVQEVLKKLAARTGFLKVLGSYPSRTAKAPVAEANTAARKPQGKQKEAPVRKPPAPSLDKKPYPLASRANRPDDTVLRIGRASIGGASPVFIAGPCSVESKAQVMACAELARDLGCQLLRGGCFKPRTSPYSFQGLGFEGLELLAEAGRACDLPIVTEVLHPSDVEAVAKVADVLQIGTRNMQNYALLKEVGRVNLPVMLKRGMMASIDEWLGAAEYILANGNQQVILCERGIRTFETATRSTLDLSAIPVIRERTHLPIIVDPSHACGTWKWVADMSDAALACGAHGIMVEFHPEPEKALSDGAQSLTFKRFTELMERMHRFHGEG